jgi:hypothetical protein
MSATNLSASMERVDLLITLQKEIKVSALIRQAFHSLLVVQKLN